MTKKHHLIFRLDTTPVTDNEAVCAWQSLRGISSTPDKVEIIQRIDGKPWKKSVIYRLVGLPPPLNVVVAKKTTAKRVSIERAIYEYVLPQLSVSILPYFGTLKDPKKPDLEWLFIGDSGDIQWNPSNPHETLAVTTWLAAFHRESSQLDMRDLLPSYDLIHYRSVLDHLAQQVKSVLATNDLLRDSDAKVVNDASRSIEILKRQWYEIECMCAGVPSCVVHSDFTPKNIRVRKSGQSIDLLVLDWETAGWGLPLEDLWAIDAEVYANAVEGWWHIRPKKVRQLSFLGRVMQSIEIMSVHAQGLSAEWTGNDFHLFAYYGKQLANFIQKLKLAIPK